MTNLANELAEYVRACFSGLWIETHEPHEAIAEIAALCRREDWRLATWNIESGLQGVGGNDARLGGHDPLAAIRASQELASAEGAGLLVLENFHRFLGSAEIVQALARRIQLGKRQRTFIVCLSPSASLPPELEKQFVVLQHALPNREELLTIAQELASAEELGDDLENVVSAAGGPTRYEAEGAYSLSLVRTGRLTAEVIADVKSQQLRKTNLVRLHEGSERFTDLGGMEAIKTFCGRALRPGARCRPRGILLVSPPGCGKSALCKAIGHEVGRPTLRLDIGALMGSLVGETERNVRRALAIAEAMAPCVLFVDEIDKALAGIGGGGDSGVAARLFGTLLTWLSDHESDVFVVATANDVSRLPPELARAERFDGVFFVDLPSREQKDAIWGIHRTRMEIAEDLSLPDDQLWTGAEISACCRLAALLELSLVDAATHIVPVAVSAADNLERLRQWASGRCLSADVGGIYTASGRSKRRRSVGLDPSAN
ncbi:AAA family ATPase [Lacipirellula sp.]|uniref:AAA family ATPase n=1 Tax=Lacipirellula sp. TaxID=2691419 RepID=UPI003D1334C5